MLGLRQVTHCCDLCEFVDWTANRTIEVEHIWTTASSCWEWKTRRLLSRSHECVLCAVKRLAVISLKGEAKPFVSPDNNTVCVCDCMLCWNSLQFWQNDNSIERSKNGSENAGSDVSSRTGLVETAGPDNDGRVLRKRVDNRNRPNDLSAV